MHSVERQNLAADRSARELLLKRTDRREGSTALHRRSCGKREAHQGQADRVSRNFQICCNPLHACNAASGGVGGFADAHREVTTARWKEIRHQIDLVLVLGHVRVHVYTWKLLKHTPCVTAQGRDQKEQNSAPFQFLQAPSPRHYNNLY